MSVNIDQFNENSTFNTTGDMNIVVCEMDLKAKKNEMVKRKSLSIMGFNNASILTAKCSIHVKKRKRRQDKDSFEIATMPFVVK